MKKIALFILFILYLWCLSFSDTHEAASCSQADVQATINAADPGDTVHIPSGDCSWTGGITITKQIVLEGNGKANTIIRSSGAYTSALFIWDGVDDLVVRSLTLKGRGDGSTNDRGLSLENDCQGFRVHDCEFSDFGYYGVQTWGRCKGVFYLCDFIDCYKPGLGYGGLVRGDESGDTELGEASWLRTVGLGDDDRTFFEDCTFSGCRHTVALTYGARCCLRYCIINANAATGNPFDSHGYDWGSLRGTRCFEIYGNNVTMGGDSNPQYFVFPHCNAGDGVYFDNTITNILNDADSKIGLEIYCCTLDNCGAWPEKDQVTARATEDGPYRFGLYIWGNTTEGNPYNYAYQKSECDDEIETMFLENRDFFYFKPKGYNRYPYPHPLRRNL